ncbi:hypothetical protein D9611_008624 [Ephemerocybe angulata]|uniref:Secreted protein n=1 Tax=Ephemerocybe angulata TaxID=980116 RepID=A0A8H5EV32_9AGAR|nr:hypothetical protein D9611_008624 [Tulosesus angulatus]
MIFICVSLFLSRRARSSLYCSSFAVPSGKAYLLLLMPPPRFRWLPATRRITDTLSIPNDLCAFRSAWPMLSGLAIANLPRGFNIFANRNTNPNAFRSTTSMFWGWRKLTFRGFTHPQLQYMDDLGGLTRPRCIAQDTSHTNIPSIYFYTFSRPDSSRDLGLITPSGEGFPPGGAPCRERAGSSGDHSTSVVSALDRAPGAPPAPWRRDLV